MILFEKVQGGSTRSPTTLRCKQATAHTIPVGATALRVVLARWPAQTQQCGLRVWRPLHVHLACWSRRTISQRIANRKVLAFMAARSSRACRSSQP
ncbi:hypothetical protein [Dictyobacter vulcani]|uniref:hypothetical protein n=1 Tax=Dictyobacter vulcani TaxID=2607529 RepID=UPI0013875BF7|nr:hypothetical protein [Dictyobacter vulcani]